MELTDITYALLTFSLGICVIIFWIKSEKIK